MLSRIGIEISLFPFHWVWGGEETYSGYVVYLGPIYVEVCWPKEIHK